MALVSVPGEHAFLEAMDALEHGLDVMVFSDNVSVEHELLLKTEAAARDLAEHVEVRQRLHRSDRAAERDAVVQAVTSERFGPCMP